MTGFTMRRMVPAVLAAGGLLLTACDAGDATTSAGDTTTATTTSATATTTSATSAPPTPAGRSSTSDSTGGLEPVDCGEVSLGTEARYRLIAQPTDSGVVGCTAAFNVVDEFTKLPPEKRAEASLGNVVLASGWTCTVDDGERADLGCTKDGLALLAQQQAG